jgi:hypothetical protein
VTGNAVGSVASGGDGIHVKPCVRLRAHWGSRSWAGSHRADLRADNDGSQRDAACCGFVREGVMRSHPPFRAAGGTPRSSEARVLVLRIRVGDLTMASSLIDVKSLPPGELR